MPFVHRSHSYSAQRVGVRLSEISSDSPTLMRNIFGLRSVGDADQPGGLWLFILEYNLGNFFRRPALPEAIKRWSLTSAQTKLINIGGRMVRHARRVVFQLAEIR